MTKRSKKRDLTSFGPVPKVLWLKVNKLRVDCNYQRDIIPKHVQNIAKNFDWRFFQPPTVCPAEDGDYWVIDGQQRVKAVSLLGVIDQLPCYLIDTPLTEEQAEAFVKINRDRRRVTPVDMYWAGLAAKDESYLEVQKLLNSVGFEVAASLGDIGRNKTNSVGTLLLCLRRDGKELTSWAVKVMCEAWPDHENPLRGTVIRAMVLLARDHIGEVDRKLLVDILSRTDIDFLCSEALTTKKLKGGNTYNILKEEIFNLYKKCTQSTQLRIVK